MLLTSRETVCFHMDQFINTNNTSNNNSNSILISKYITSAIDTFGDYCKTLLLTEILYCEVK